MSQIDKWEEKRKHKTHRKSKPHEARNVPLTPAPDLPDSITVGNLRVEGDLDLSFFDSLEADQSYVVNPSGAEEGQVYTVAIDSVSGEQMVVATDAATIAVTTDGAAPASSPTPTIQGGPRLFAVKWTGVANPDPITYEIHVSDTSGFTPDGTTLAGETPGGLAFIKRLPDGTDFTYGITYYFKIIAKDEDGEAAASVEASAQLDPNASSDQLAGSITAEHFEAVLSIASSMIAGTWGGPNVQTGFGAKDDGAGSPELDASFVGIRMYDGSGDTDPVFRVDASDGTVQVKGRIYFGANYGSRLTRNDMIQVAAQEAGVWQQAVLEQSESFTDTGITSIDVSWPATPTVGNLLLVVVNSWDAGGNATHTWDGSKYSNVKANTWGGATNGRQGIYKRVATGTDDDTMTFDKNVDIGIVQMFEFSGVQDVEDATSGTENSTTGSSPSSTGPTNSPLTQRGLVFATTVVYGVQTLDIFDPGSPISNPRFTSGTTPSGFTFIGEDNDRANPDQPGSGGEGTVDYDKVISRVWMSDLDTGSPEAENSVADVDAWRGTIVSFKSKATAVESADADTVRLYAADVDDDPLFHTINEGGAKRALAFGKAGERWDFELMSGTFNWASTANHTVQNGNITVTGVKVGDICMFLDSASGQRQFIWRAEPIATVADQITLRGFNAGSGTLDPASDTYYFLVIHRS